MPDILSNPKARRDYHILETFEAGIVLRGTEVKALRAGKGQISDAFARVENDEVFLYNAHIDEYSHGNLQNHEPKATRKLLLHKRQIDHLVGRVQAKGLTLVPLKLYLKGNRAKIELGLARGKKLYDKREAIAQRDAVREMARAVKIRSRC